MKITEEVNNNDEKIIENIVTISSLNPLNEFQKFLLSNNNRTDFRCDYSEQKVNIFSLPNNIAIGHCTSQCLTMSKGTALQFRNKFNNVQNLIDQEKKPTEIAYLKNGRQWILYLITKNKYYDKSAYTKIFSTLANTRKFCIENNITTLALPKICTGQDKKDWNVISTMIKFIFQNTQIKIIICLLPTNENEKQNKYFKNNDSQTTNITIGKNFNNTINDNLKNEITLIAGSFIKTENVPGDGDCGAHALRICLKQHGIYRKTVELLNMLGIPNCKSGYYLKDDDLAFICDQFNLNLYLIHEDSENTNAIIYWKLNRKNIGIFNKDCHWTPGIITETHKEIKPKEQIKITGADNNELIQKGTTEVTITINTLKYQIKVYVIEGLNCNLLLGNDFNIKYNLIIDFKNKEIKIENNTIKIVSYIFAKRGNTVGRPFQTVLRVTNRSVSPLPPDTTYVSADELP